MQFLSEDSNKRINADGKYVRGADAVSQVARWLCETLEEHNKSYGRYATYKTELS